MKTVRTFWEGYPDLSSLVVVESTKEAYGMCGEFFFEQGGHGNMPCPTEVEEVAIEENPLDLENNSFVVFNKSNHSALCIITKDKKYDIPRVIVLDRNLSKVEDAIKENFGERVLFYLAEDKADFMRETLRMKIGETVPMSELKFLGEKHFSVTHIKKIDDFEI